MTRTRRSWRIGLVITALLFAAMPAAMADFDAAMGHFKAGKFLEAASEFQTLVDQSPEYADGYFMLGVCFMKTSKPAARHSASASFGGSPTS